MFTATGFIVMCVAASSTCTANAVESPPRPCGPTPSLFTAARELVLEPGALRIVAAAAERPAGRGDLREMHAKVGRCRRCRRRRSSADRSCRRASSTQSITKVLIAVDALGRNRHPAERSCSPIPLPLGIISIVSALRALGEIDVDDRDADAAGGVLVLARQRMHDRGAQRMLDASRARSRERSPLQIRRRRRARRGRWSRCRSGRRCPGT